MEIQGIAIPIVFPYRYRGDKLATLEVYFSCKPLELIEIDLVDGCISHKKELAKVLKYGDLRSPLCLLPLDPVPITKNEAPWGMKFAMTPIDSNPTTATKHERLAFLPVDTTNAPALVKKFSSRFYVSIEGDEFTLHIRKNDGDEFYSVPSQPVSPKCWIGFAHHHIQLVQKIGNLGVSKFDKIPWSDLIFLSERA